MTYEGTAMTHHEIFFRYASAAATDGSNGKAVASMSVTASERCRRSGCKASKNALRIPRPNTGEYETRV
jgi:hypothetical protein